MRNELLLFFCLHSGVKFFFLTPSVKNFLLVSMCTARPGTSPLTFLSPPSRIFRVCLLWPARAAPVKRCSSFFVLKTNLPTDKKKPGKTAPNVWPERHSCATHNIKSEAYNFCGYISAAELSQNKRAKSVQAVPTMTELFDIYNKNFGNLRVFVFYFPPQLWTETFF